MVTDLGSGVNQEEVVGDMMVVECVRVEDQEEVVVYK